MIPRMGPDKNKITRGALRIGLSVAYAAVWIFVGYSFAPAIYRSTATSQPIVGRLVAVPVSGGVEVYLPGDQPPRPAAEIAVNGEFKATIDLNPGVTTVPFSQFSADAGRPMPEDTAIRRIRITFSSAADERLVEHFHFRSGSTD